LILSRLAQVLDVGESLHSLAVLYGVVGEKPAIVSLREAAVRFFESLAVFFGVDGAVTGSIEAMAGTAVGRARKNR
jgi:hypothetical protein